MRPRQADPTIPFALLIILAVLVSMCARRAEAQCQPPNCFPELRLEIWLPVVYHEFGVLGEPPVVPQMQQP